MMAAVLDMAGIMAECLFHIWLRRNAQGRD